MSTNTNTMATAANWREQEYLAIKPAVDYGGKTNVDLITFLYRDDIIVIQDDDSLLVGNTQTDISNFLGPFKKTDENIAKIINSITRKPTVGRSMIAAIDKQVADLVAISPLFSNIQGNQAAIDTLVMDSPQARQQLIGLAKCIYNAMAFIHYGDAAKDTNAADTIASASLDIPKVGSIVGLGDKADTIAALDTAGNNAGGDASKVAVKGPQTPEEINKFLEEFRLCLDPDNNVTLASAKNNLYSYLRNTGKIRDKVSMMSNEDLINRLSPVIKCKKYGTGYRIAGVKLI